MSKKNKNLYIIDCYYDVKEDKIHYITRDKTTGDKKYFNEDNPKVNIFLSKKFDKKINYIKNRKELEQFTLPYKDLISLKRYLKKQYKLKYLKQSEYPDNNYLMNKYPEILLLEKEIYGDYRIESINHQYFEIPDLKDLYVTYWDIEVVSDSEYEEPENANSPIVLISYFLSKEGILYVNCLLPNDKETNDVDTNRILGNLKNKIEEEITIKIKYFNTEEDLIKDFLKNIRKQDILVGWNSLKYDTLYLYNRCKKLNLQKYFKSVFGELQKIYNNIEETYYTTKILSLDYIHLIKAIDKKNYPSFRLDYIAKKKLKGKLTKKVKLGNFKYVYLNNLELFIEYSAIDTYLVFLLENNAFKILELLFQLKKLTGGFTFASLAVNNYLDTYLRLFSKKLGIEFINSLKTYNYLAPRTFDIYLKVNEIDKKDLPKYKVKYEIFNKILGASVVETNRLLEEETNNEEEIERKEYTDIVWEVYKSGELQVIFYKTLDVDGSIKIEYDLINKKLRIKKILELFDKANEFLNKYYKIVEDYKILSEEEASDKSVLESQLKEIENYKNKIIEIKKELLKLDFKILTERPKKENTPFLISIDKYPGAYVKNPIPGLKKVGIDLDAASLYPTIIHKYNISVDTWKYLVPENLALKYIYDRKNFPDNIEMILYDVEEDKFYKIKDAKKWFDKIYKNGFILSEIGAIFYSPKIKEGIFRKLIKYPIAMRKKVKKQMEEAYKNGNKDLGDTLNIIQLVYKLIANSLYGYLGYKYSRVFNIVLASAITLGGQFLIKYVSVRLNNFLDKILEK